MKTKPILCLDFDGVIHSYTSGWQGADVVSDPPVDGALDFLGKAVEVFEVCIFSSRSGQDGGIAAMQRWLNHHCRKKYNMVPFWVDGIKWPTEKPATFLTIDDRAITFEGAWPNVEELLKFKPWNKR